MPTPKRLLTPRQQRFVEYYVTTLNATQSAREAGYTGDPESTGCRLLTYVKVREAIAAAKERLSARVEVKQADIIRELARIAFGDRRSLMTWGPGGVQLRESSELSEDEAAAVSEVSESTSATGGSVKIKTHDKVRALELLGKHLGVFVERHEIAGPGGGPIGAKVAISAAELQDAVLSALGKV